jgi:predicted RNase H-like HicB family nuclease
MKFTVVLEPEEAGGFSVHCPALPGCASQGETPDEALTNIREAILGILAVRRKHGMPAAVETPEGVAEEIKRVLAGRAAEG